MFESYDISNIFFLGAISRRRIQLLTQISFRRREKLGGEPREPAESVNRKECKSENGEWSREGEEKGEAQVEEFDDNLSDEQKVCRNENYIIDTCLNGCLVSAFSWIRFCDACLNANKVLESFVNLVFEIWQIYSVWNFKLQIK